VWISSRHRQKYYPAGPEALSESTVFTLFVFPRFGARLKGGQTLKPKGVDKKKKKKKKRSEETVEDQPDLAAGETKPDTETEETILPAGTKPQELYERDFKLETERAVVGKARGTAWGVTYSKPPDILHGYAAPVAKIHTNKG
jgi:hypothetical protein